MLRGDRVRQRREQIGMSQKDLAAKLGMAQTLVSRLERGDNPNPHTELLTRLARALHCSIDWLVGLYDDDPDAALVVAAAP